MTIREVQALLLLYQAAGPADKERAQRLVPELASWDVAQSVPVCPDHPDECYNAYNTSLHSRRKCFKCSWTWTS